jgi:hypothetical protein
VDQKNCLAIRDELGADVADKRFAMFQWKRDWFQLL